MKKEKVAICSTKARKICSFLINPLPDDKILDRPKLKQIADNILNCNQNKKKSAI